MERTNTAGVKLVRDGGERIELFRVWTLKIKTMNFHFQVQKVEPAAFMQVAYKPPTALYCWYVCCCGTEVGWGRYKGSCLLCWHTWLMCVPEGGKKHTPGYKLAWLMPLGILQVSRNSGWYLERCLSAAFPMSGAVKCTPSLVCNKYYFSCWTLFYNHVRGSQQACLTT